MVDRNSVDPNFFIPTRVIQTSMVGDIVSPESLAFMSLPGFQMGANGERFGIDLYFPNTGAFPGNTQTNKSSVVREEVIDNSLAIATSSVEQIVQANDQKAVLGRTIYGFPLIIDDDNVALNHGLIFLNAFLPKFTPHLEGSDNPVNTRINRNLFFAANNTRIPNRSYTLYHGGFGSATSPEPETELKDIPAGRFHGVWLGLSPIIDYDINQGIGYEATGPRRDIVNAGGEGGKLETNDSVDMVSAVNGDILSVSNLHNSYTQVYLSMFQRDVNLVTTTEYQEDIRFVPHVSFTGNITNVDSVLRYYTGTIFDDEIKGYLGTDYSYNSGNGWRYNVGAIGYINPNRDYYSNTFANVLKSFPLSPDSTLRFSTGLFYAFDRPTEVNEIFFNSETNTVNVGAGFSWKTLNFGLSYNFDNVLPNSLDQILTLNLDIPLNDFLTLSGFYVPIDGNTVRNRGGLGIVWRLSSDYNSPRLGFNWSNLEYEFGRDVFGHEMTQNDNRFTVFLRFGTPKNPFDPTTAEQLRNQPVEPE
jgi:hypothetical protein